ncbi:uncharacterized protein MONBRDRAFT_7788 [Monosiga brevicollis MX1]|uniref:Uncharacterized protein n=1 Tax=Monosiga brevicollis TaxID=81824 RepID=A9UXE9_MONBE|nr:uncharacterized protein MONBRDRAFT_7788 [Monosiga brevicollis MX1]EDQ89993.1 predicted protein [Monosiga brevicollis MX1]|eukprot:XP_001745415.1 hypothetical protein [Monosiga brevicollis MX1]
MATRLAKQQVLEWLSTYTIGLDPDRISFSLWEGAVVLEHVQLNCAALNQIFHQQGVPLRCEHGQCERLRLAIPWLSLGAEPLSLDVSGAFFRFQLLTTSTAAASTKQESPEPSSAATFCDADGHWHEGPDVVATDLAADDDQDNSDAKLGDETNPPSASLAGNRLLSNVRLRLERCRIDLVVPELDIQVHAHVSLVELQRAWQTEALDWPDAANPINMATGATLAYCLLLTLLEHRRGRSTDGSVITRLGLRLAPICCDINLATLLAAYGRASFTHQHPVKTTGKVGVTTSASSLGHQRRQRKTSASAWNVNLNLASLECRVRLGVAVENTATGTSDAFSEAIGTATEEGPLPTSLLIVAQTLHVDGYWAPQSAEPVVELTLAHAHVNGDLSRDSPLFHLSKLELCWGRADSQQSADSVPADRFYPHLSFNLVTLAVAINPVQLSVVSQLVILIRSLPSTQQGLSDHVSSQSFLPKMAYTVKVDLQSVSLAIADVQGPVWHHIWSKSHLVLDARPAYVALTARWLTGSLNADTQDLVDHNGQLDMTGDLTSIPWRLRCHGSLPPLHVSLETLIRLLTLLDPIFDASLLVGTQEPQSHLKRQRQTTPIKRPALPAATPVNFDVCIQPICLSLTVPMASKQPYALQCCAGPIFSSTNATKITVKNVFMAVNAPRAKAGHATAGKITENERLMVLASDLEMELDVTDAWSIHLRAPNLQPILLDPLLQIGEQATLIVQRTLKPAASSRPGEIGAHKHTRSWSTVSVLSDMGEWHPETPILRVSCRVPLLCVRAQGAALQIAHLNVSLGLIPVVEVDTQLTWKELNWTSFANHRHAVVRGVLMPAAGDPRLTLRGTAAEMAVSLPAFNLNLDLAHASTGMTPSANTCTTSQAHKSTLTNPARMVAVALSSHFCHFGGMCWHGSKLPQPSKHQCQPSHQTLCRARRLMNPTGKIIDMQASAVICTAVPCAWHTVREYLRPANCFCPTMATQRFMPLAELCVGPGTTTHHISRAHAAHTFKVIIVLGAEQGSLSAPSAAVNPNAFLTSRGMLIEQLVPSMAGSGDVQQGLIKCPSATELLGAVDVRSQEAPTQTWIQAHGEIGEVACRIDESFSDTERQSTTLPVIASQCLGAEVTLDLEDLNHVHASLSFSALDLEPGPPCQGKVVKVEQFEMTGTLHPQRMALGCQVGLIDLMLNEDWSHVANRIRSAVQNPCTLARSTAAAGHFAMEAAVADLPVVPIFLPEVGCHAAVQPGGEQVVVLNLTPLDLYWDNGLAIPTLASTAMTCTQLATMSWALVNRAGDHLAAAAPLVPSSKRIMVVHQQHSAGEARPVMLHTQFAGHVLRIRTNATWNAQLALHMPTGQIWTASEIFAPWFQLTTTSTVYIRQTDGVLFMARTARSAVIDGKDSDSLKVEAMPFVRVHNYTNVSCRLVLGPRDSASWEIEPGVSWLLTDEMLRAAQITSLVDLDLSLTCGAHATAWTVGHSLPSDHDLQVTCEPLLDGQAYVFGLRGLFWLQNSTQLPVEVSGSFPCPSSLTGPGQFAGGHIGPSQLLFSSSTTVSTRPAADADGSPPPVLELRVPHYGIILQTSWPASRPGSRRLMPVDDLVIRPVLHVSWDARGARIQSRPEQKLLTFIGPAQSEAHSFEVQAHVMSMSERGGHRQVLLHERQWHMLPHRIFWDHSGQSWHLNLNVRLAASEAVAWQFSAHIGPTTSQVRTRVDDPDAPSLLVMQTAYGWEVRLIVSELPHVLLTGRVGRLRCVVGKQQKPVMAGHVVELELHAAAAQDLPCDFGLTLQDVQVHSPLLRRDRLVVARLGTEPACRVTGSVLASRGLIRSFEVMPGFLAVHLEPDLVSELHAWAARTVPALQRALGLAQERHSEYFEHASNPLEAAHPLLIAAWRVAPFAIRLTSRLDLGSLPQVDNLTLRLSELVIRGPSNFSTPSGFLEVVAAHYVADICLGAGWLVPSLAILGSPKAIFERLQEELHHTFGNEWAGASMSRRATRILQATAVHLSSELAEGASTAAREASRGIEFLHHDVDFHSFR